MNGPDDLAEQNVLKLADPAVSPSTGSAATRFDTLFQRFYSELFGLVYRVPEEQQAIYRRTFVNLPFVNGDESWELPIPATYVIDRDGTILFASANEDYTERPEPLEILASLE